MNDFTLILMLLFFTLKMEAQPTLLEIKAGNEYVAYQHTIAQVFEKDSKFGLVHLGSMIVRHTRAEENQDLPNEIMNQAYFSTKISKSLTLLTGIHYTNFTGIRGTAAIQFSYHKAPWHLILIPRLDVQHHGAYELFSLFEFRPKLGERFSLYTRIQTLTSHGTKGHNRSYQQFRVGLARKSTQVGLALNLDEYGSKQKVNVNFGLFYRKEIF